MIPQSQLLWTNTSGFDQLGISCIRYLFLNFIFPHVKKKKKKKKQRRCEGLKQRKCKGHAKRESERLERETDVVIYISEIETDFRERERRREKAWRERERQKEG